MPDQVKQKLDAHIEPQRKVFRKWRIKLSRPKVQQKVIRRSLLGFNIFILLFILIFVFQKPTQTSGTASASGLSAAALNSLAPNPLDQLASANIALTVAQMNNLPETTPINNQAESQQAEIAMASTDDNIVSKPQVTETSLKSRANITNYAVQTGDTIASIANKFGVTSNSIIWSNDLASGIAIPGQSLIIPPVNGIVYKVKAGDTPTSLAQRFQSSATQIIAYNDSEISGLTPGEEIIIPNGVEASSGRGVGLPGISSSYAPLYGSNGYDYGYCTWYVASQVSVPSNWGNAATWAYYAALTGWNVSSAPSVGSIAQTPYAAGGEGHVAIVVGVSGGQVEIKDMNNTGDGGGYGRVGQGWYPISEFQNYIAQ